MRAALAACGLLVSAPLAAQADAVELLGAAAGTDSVTVGQPFPAEVRVRAPAGSTVALALPAHRAYEVAEPARPYPAERPATHRVVATLVLWVADPPATAAGEARVTLPGGEVRSLPVALPLPRVRAVLPADSAMPRGPKDIVPLAPERGAWWRWLAIGGALLALALVLAVLVRRLRVRRPGGDDPRARALAALDALRAAGLPERGETVEFYARLSRILRDAAAPGVGVDLTTGEAVEVLRGEAVPAGRVEVLARLLAGADLAKFAGRAPSAGAADEDWRAARAWVEACDAPGGGEDA